MSIISEMIRMHTEAQGKNIRIKSFKLPSSKVRALAEEFNGMRLVSDTGDREEDIKATEDSIRAGTFFVYGVEVVVYPTFDEITRDFLRDNRDNLLDVMRDSNSLFSQLTVQ